MTTTTRRPPPAPLPAPCKFARALLKANDRKTIARLLWAWRKK